MQSQAFEAMVKIENAIFNLDDYDGHSDFRGISVCLRGQLDFINAFLLIRMIRRIGCTLPIEIWYISYDEAIVNVLKPYGVEFRVAPKELLRRAGLMRVHAIVHSKFRQVLSLDPSNFAVRCPEYLFCEPSFRLTGTLFWYSHSSKSAELYKIMELVKPPCTPSFDLAQILVDREQCWEPLNLALAILRDVDPLARLAPDDADVWFAAWEKLGQPVSVLPMMPQILLGTDPDFDVKMLVQRDFHGNPIFQNRNLGRWRLHGVNPYVSGTLLDGECRVSLDELRRQWALPVVSSEPEPDSEVLSREISTLLTGSWILRAWEMTNGPQTGLAQQQDPVQGLSKSAGYRECELRFSNDGDFGLHSNSKVTYWRLAAEKDGLVLNVYSENGDHFARFVRTEAAWEGVSETKGQRVPLVLVRPAQLYPGARPPQPDFPQGLIRHDLLGRFGSQLRVWNSSAELQDHLTSIYACAAAVELGFEVVFVTPFAPWFSRVRHTGLEVVLPSAAEISVECIDLHRASTSEREFATSRARWYAAVLHDELLPRRPAFIDRQLESKPVGFLDYIVLSPIATIPGEQWPEAHWLRLSYLLRELGFDLVVIGTEGQETRLDALCSQLGVFWLATNSAERQGEILLGSKALITSENSVAHFAGLLGIPCIAIHSIFEPEYLWDCTSLTGVFPTVQCTFCRMRRSRSYVPSCSTACSAVFTIDPETIVMRLKYLLLECRRETANEEPAAEHSIVGTS